MAHRHEVQEQIEIVFGELWRRPRLSGLHRGFRPNLDSYHTDDPNELIVVVEVPGIDPNSLAIAVSGRVLVIAGERTRAKAGGRVYQQMEIEYGPFERRVRLAEDVDPEGARAVYDRGVVTISLSVTGRPGSGGDHTIIVEAE